ncbi:Uncharacterised protein [uncultured archaeon]|nr:Uncharacterised protein [uncultured archaeon]
MAEKNSVYVKLDYGESLESKKNLLLSEASLLNLLKIIKRYNAIRLEEFKAKAKIKKALKELEGTIKEAQSFFPFFKIPERMKKENSAESGAAKVKKDNDLEFQLMEIQRKLNLLGGKY